jgi:hypothetical protein
VLTEAEEAILGRPVAHGVSFRHYRVLTGRGPRRPMRTGSAGAPHAIDAVTAARASGYPQESHSSPQRFAQNSQTDYRRDGSAAITKEPPPQRPIKRLMGRLPLG